ncbi:MAG TPA: DUF177 domain-containing protein [Solirubrobacterales bacterium]|nr:DUF177 domain-containing protein [Solirubrobacterales bacterium]HNN18999.1 DUF177 domain-containing protein [Solirubrobacterales bacterium]
MLIEKVDLDALGLSYGDATRIQGEVAPARVSLGGQDYEPVPAEPAFLLEVSRTSAGYALRLRFEVGLSGPCFRCLEDATASVSVDAREVDQPVEPIPIQGSGRIQNDDEDEDESSAAELTSPYVEEGTLDLAAWTHDALILSLPEQILCQPDCLGLCPVCGESLNGADPAAHDHGQDIDPRWAKLRDLK